jgi:hypothetical protein
MIRKIKAALKGKNNSISESTLGNENAFCRLKIEHGHRKFFKENISYMESSMQEMNSLIEKDEEINAISINWYEKEIIRRM